jgi:magnesium-transporting ATPase (P-type)
MKKSALEYLINILIIVIFAFEVIGCITMAWYADKWELERKNIHPYLGLDNLEDKSLTIRDKELADDVHILLITGRWMIVLSNLVPISLLVTVEAIKFAQAYFIMWDANLMDEKTGT